jgi:hypothetical protein
MVSERGRGNTACATTMAGRMTMASFSFEERPAPTPPDGSTGMVAVFAQAARSGPEAGPGWYDSSWDLQRGLIVREGLPRDADLQEWLQHELLGAPAQAPLSLV